MVMTAGSVKLWQVRVSSLWITSVDKSTRPLQGGTIMALTSTFRQMLDKFGTLSEQRGYRSAPRAASRLARGVLIAIGIALCSASPAGQAMPLPKLTAYQYSLFQIKELQTSCLFAIANRESNTRFDAVNKSSGAYGAWQILNERVKYLTPLEQVDWAIRYAEHRYGSPCQAWEFWKENSWW